MTAYASSADLTVWLDSDTTMPDDVDRLLDRASELIDDVVRQPFTVDTLGNPTDENVQVILQSAVCAQVEQWLEVGEENDVDGLAGTQVSTTGFSGLRAPTLGPRALRILRTSGLLGQPGIPLDVVCA